jgi:hypothetical protein
MDFIDFLLRYTWKSIGVGIAMIAAFIAIAIFLGPTDFAVNLSIGIGIVGFLLILWFEIRHAQQEGRNQRDD